MTSVSDPIRLVLELSALHTRVLKRIENQLSVHGISFAEFLVLHALHRAPNETLRRIDLADNVGLSASGVTRLLKPMEKLHWIEKQQNPRDARVSLVKLSASGKTLYADAFVSCTQTAGSLSKALTNTQITHFLALIKAVK
jgi:DNA-binding MarR family transcriptional regulator